MLIHKFVIPLLLRHLLLNRSPHIIVLLILIPTLLLISILTLIVFSASSADKDVELSFQFVSESNDGTEPYTTESIIVSGASEIQYTVTIPAQEGNSYNYIYLEFLNVDDVSVTINDIKIEPVP